MNVLNRIMGLILAAIAIQFMLDGFRISFPRALGPAA
jgi:small neutral amino acid transporter SnatA (MarC family)